LAVWWRPETPQISREIMPGRPHRLDRQAFAHLATLSPIGDMPAAPLVFVLCTLIDSSVFADN
jgi:hypothetical protein